MTHPKSLIKLGISYFKLILFIILYCFLISCHTQNEAREYNQGLNDEFIKENTSIGLLDHLNHGQFEPNKMNHTKHNHQDFKLYTLLNMNYQWIKKCPWTDQPLTPSMRYIIVTQKEMNITNHYSFLKELLDNSYDYTLVGRRNPAVEKYLTDFAVIETKSSWVVNTLKQHPLIKAVYENRIVHRKVQSLNCVKRQTTVWDPEIKERKGRSLLLNQEITEKMEAHLLWDNNFKGQNVHVGVFDTGCTSPNAFKHIEENVIFTSPVEKSQEDELGHGTFIAGVIASQGPTCRGFAPESRLHIFKVFTSTQHSYTSWFLDAFNYALKTGVHILNLSIGGPDYMDRPFIEKVQELTASGIIFVSAIGNDGPLYGSLNNPADMPSVLGVGGLNDNGIIASFSSRGVTTREIQAGGYGRAKPDVVTYGLHVRGVNRFGSGCKVLSGTSVASPIVAGVVALMASSLPEKNRWKILNPSSVKQILFDGASKVPQANIFESGAGAISLRKSLDVLKNYKPHASFHPSSLKLTDCPYMWPYCSQPIFHSAQPIVVNVTILNGMGVTGRVRKPPVFIPNKNGAILDVKLNYEKILWPWTGWLSVTISVKPIGRFFEGLAGGHIEMVIESPPQPGDKTRRKSTIVLPLEVQIIRPPSRSNRILFDMYHNIQYPPGYIPRDDLRYTRYLLDWNGDHIHTNYRDMYLALRRAGYYIDVLQRDFTKFDAKLYGTLMIIDPEDEFSKDEKDKLEDDISNLGLSVIILADWYNRHVMNSIEFYDENTRSIWKPLTGGANLPSINGLLEPYGIAFGNGIFHGHFGFGTTDSTGVGIGSSVKYPYNSGSHFIKLPRDARVGVSSLNSHHTTYPRLSDHVVQVPILTLYQHKRGRLAVFGDSTCVDSAHTRRFCFNFIEQLLSYTNYGQVLIPELTTLHSDFVSFAAGDIPIRPHPAVFNHFLSFSHIHDPKTQLIYSAEHTLNQSRIAYFEQVKSHPSHNTSSIFDTLRLTYILVVLLLVLSGYMIYRYLVSTNLGSTRYIHNPYERETRLHV